MTAAVKKKTTGQTVFEDLRDKILSGEFPPGSHLPSERDMVSKLGVSRGAIREAIQRLEQSKLVSVNHGGGTRVNNFYETAGLELLVSLINHNKFDFDLKIIRSLIEMRTALGVDAARLAAQRRSEEIKDQLLEQVDALEKLTSAPEQQEKIIEIWDLIIEASENLAYKLSMNTLKETYSKFSQFLGSAMLDSYRLNDFQKLIQAIVAKHHVKAESIARTMVERDTKKILDIVDQAWPSSANG